MYKVFTVNVAVKVVFVQLDVYNRYVSYLCSTNSTCLTDSNDSDNSTDFAYSID